jgi:hypothetical protein
MLCEGMTEHHAAPSTSFAGLLPLLELPEAALDLVMQRLDACSLASTAATCSKLKHVLRAYISVVELRYKSFKDPKKFDRFIRWLESRNRSSRSDRLTQCSIFYKPP